jgi:hypothetical protein
MLETQLNMKLDIRNIKKLKVGGGQAEDRSSV